MLLLNTFAPSQCDGVTRGDMGHCGDESIALRTMVCGRWVWTRRSRRYGMDEGMEEGVDDMGVDEGVWMGWGVGDGVMWYGQR